VAADQREETPLAGRSELERLGLGSVEITWQETPKLDWLSYIAGGAATFSLTLIAYSYFPDLDFNSVAAAIDQIDEAVLSFKLASPFDKINQALE
jgi:hypothetical protein